MQVIVTVAAVKRTTMTNTAVRMVVVEKLARPSTPCCTQVWAPRHWVWWSHSSAPGRKDFWVRNCVWSDRPCCVLVCSVVFCGCCSVFVFANAPTVAGVKCPTKKRAPARWKPRCCRRRRCCRRPHQRPPWNITTKSICKRVRRRLS